MPLGQVFICMYEGLCILLVNNLERVPSQKKKLLERVKEFLTLCNLVLRRPFLPSFLQQIHIVLWEKHVSPVVPFHP